MSVVCLSLRRRQIELSLLHTERRFWQFQKCFCANLAEAGLTDSLFDII